MYLPSASASLHNITIERSIAEWEVLGILTEEFREDSLALVACRVFVDIAVHEAIHQRRVGVDVDVEIQVNVLQSWSSSLTVRSL